jgi:hypothetical protein
MTSSSGTSERGATVGESATLQVSSAAVSLGSSAERKAAQAPVAAYHEQQLAAIQQQVRSALDAFDAGQLDAFEVDEVFHRYTRAARELWKTCVMPNHPQGVAWMLDDMAARGETIDRWESGAPRRHRQ